METGGMVDSVQQSNDMSIIQKIIGVLTAPGKAFQAIVAKPDWLVPFIITVAVGLLFVFVAGDIIMQEQLQQQEKQMIEAGVDDDQIQQRLDTTEKFMGNPYIMPAFAVVMPLLLWLIVAACFTFVGKVILGGEGGFKTVFSITAWSWLVHGVGALVILPLVLARETILITLSPAVLLSDASRFTFLYQFLNKLDVFNIWFVAVLSIGLAVLYKMETKKVAIAAFTVFVLWALGAAGWTAMFS